MITDHLREPVLCAVSGGADSMYMLARLKEQGFSVLAAHFNHGLRGAESDRDEAFVRDYCEKNAIPFTAGRGDVRAYAEDRGMSLETAARELRYAFLEQTAAELHAGCIATAHNANDNAETVLFHLARGSGLRGLGGIPPVRGNIVRPVLDDTRETALAWLEDHGVGYVEDSTNALDDCDRNRIRHAVTPVLESINAGFYENVSRTAALLRADEDYLRSLAREHIASNGADAAALCALPEPVAARAVQELAGSALSMTHVRALLKTAREGGSADLPGLRVSRRDGKLIFDPADCEPLAEREVFEGVTELREAGLRLSVRRVCGTFENRSPYCTFYFAEDRICGTITVSARRAGDILRPIGRGCTKTLKQLFQEAGVESWRRSAWPVVRDEKGVLAVYGIAADERCAAGGENTNYVELDFVPIRREE